MPLRRGGSSSVNSRIFGTVRISRPRGVSRQPTSAWLPSRQSERKARRICWAISSSDAGEDKAGLERFAPAMAISAT